jgi:ferredoxin-NADP reductase
VIDEAPDIKCFRLARPDGFAFTAGQFLTVRVRADGRELVRCYSISSAPSASGYLEIGVKRQGLVSKTLHATLRPGSLLPVKAPAGAFVYPTADHRPLLLIAGGIGITPLISMVRHAIAEDPTREVTLLYSAQTEQGLAFRDELRSVARRHPHVRVVFAVTRGASAADVFPGRIDESLIQATVPDVTRAIAMICGPAAMIDAMRGLLGGLGLAPAQIRSEVFEQAVAAASGLHRAGGSELPAGAGASHRIQCARSGAAVRAEAGQTLLEAAEAGGVDIDSLCRSGVCGTCRTRVIEGDAECDSTILDDAERKDGYVLACVTHLRSDCVVEI